MIKLGVEAYLYPSTLAVITDEGAQVCYFYLPLEVLRVSGNENCHSSLSLFFFFYQCMHFLLVGLW